MQMDRGFINRLYKNLYSPTIEQVNKTYNQLNRLMNWTDNSENWNTNGQQTYEKLFMLPKPSEENQNQNYVGVPITRVEWQPLKKQTIHVDKDSGEGTLIIVGM